MTANVSSIVVTYLEWINQEWVSSSPGPRAVSDSILTMKDFWKYNTELLFVCMLFLIWLTLILTLASTYPSIWQFVSCENAHCKSESNVQKLTFLVTSKDSPDFAQARILSWIDSEIKTILIILFY